MARSEAQIQPHNIYEIKANPTNVHWGYFSAAVKPALTVDSGESLLLKTCRGWTRRKPSAPASRRARSRRTTVRSIGK